MPLRLAIEHRTWRPVYPRYRTTCDDRQPRCRAPVPPAGAGHPGGTGPSRDPGDGTRRGGPADRSLGAPAAPGTDDPDPYPVRAYRRHGPGLRPDTGRARVPRGVAELPGHLRLGRRVRPDAP